MNIAVLNGPNLNLLGTREPHVYGTTTLAEIEATLRRVGDELGATLSFFQSNHEGALVDAVQALRGTADGAVINAGAYSHSSIALRDAFASISMPYVEVHVSNIFAREPERRHSILATGARAVVCGFGAHGYELALRGLVASLKSSG